MIYQRAIIKDLRQINLLTELETRIQEVVEIIPQSVSYERIFHSYTDNHTSMRTHESIQLNQNVNMFVDENLTDHRFVLDFYSTTLYIFPRQRNEKFISEIHYIPEHIIIKYKTILEFLAATLTMSSTSCEHFYRMVKDIFYRI